VRSGGSDSASFHRHRCLLLRSSVTAQSSPTRWSRAAAPVAPPSAAGLSRGGAARTRGEVERKRGRRRRCLSLTPRTPGRRRLAYHRHYCGRRASAPQCGVPLARERDRRRRTHTTTKPRYLHSGDHNHQLTGGVELPRFARPGTFYSRRHQSGGLPPPTTLGSQRQRGERRATGGAVRRRWCRSQNDRRRRPTTEVARRGFPPPPVPTRLDPAGGGMAAGAGCV
jgi:hypothetical protein